MGAWSCRPRRARCDAARRAVAEKAFLSWVPTLRAGLSEREAASRLIAALLSSGADGLAFDPIIATAPVVRRPTPCPVTTDWKPWRLGHRRLGACVDGHVSDLTRVRRWPTLGSAV